MKKKKKSIHVSRALLIFIEKKKTLDKGTLLSTDRPRPRPINHNTDRLTSNRGVYPKQTQNYWGTGGYVQNQSYLINVKIYLRIRCFIPGYSSTTI